MCSDDDHLYAIHHSKTPYRYHISTNQWQYVANLSALSNMRESSFCKKAAMVYNAPINVQPVGGRQGMGWGFDIFQKFAVKFPAHRQIIPVKCNQISPPRAAHCAVKYPKARPEKGTIKISPNKTLKSLFILRYCITKDTCSCYSCNYTF